jgi:putative ABC transport system permease protein
VVNETLVKELGFASNEEALGKRFWTGMMGWHAEITGVVSDFNMPLYTKRSNLLDHSIYSFRRQVGSKNTGRRRYTGVINQLNTSYKKVFTDGIFEYNFLDQKLDALYKSEMRLFSLFKIFSV